MPDGAFVLVDDAPWLVLGGELFRWTPGGYAGRRPANGRAPMLTQLAVLPALRAGWGVVAVPPSELRLIRIFTDA